MSLAPSLPERPLTFSETGSRSKVPEVDYVSPLYATKYVVTKGDGELVIACILMKDEYAEFAGFCPELMEWNSVAVIPDITDRSGIQASLDFLDGWMVDHYALDFLVPIELHPDTLTSGRL